MGESMLALIQAGRQAQEKIKQLGYVVLGVQHPQRSIQLYTN
jgi:hypothetical protein